VAGLSIGPLRWGIVVVALDPVEGHEQAGTRCALVVSYEPFHRSGLMTICPVTAARADARYPGDVPLPAGEAGQTKPGVVICSQVRTISMRRLRGAPLDYLTDPGLRRQVRVALAHHLGLDIPAVTDRAP
jgi:mRNA-degrading endonuclease toxin of MazEF toxin-antitoxin module